LLADRPWSGSVAHASTAHIAQNDSAKPIASRNDTA
jgi:hypothetical protein